MHLIWCSTAGITVGCFSEANVFSAGACPNGQPLWHTGQEDHCIERSTRRQSGE